MNKADKIKKRKASKWYRGWITWDRRRQDRCPCAYHRKELGHSKARKKGTHRADFWEKYLRELDR